MRPKTSSAWDPSSIFTAVSRSGVGSTSTTTTGSGVGSGAASGALAEQLAYALAHFPCRLVGKGDRRNTLGRDAALVNKVGDLARDNAGLAAAGTGQDQEGAIDVGDGLALSGIEIVHRDTTKAPDCNSVRI